MRSLLSLTACLLLAILPAARADFSIMPLGDSITYGAKLNNAGYRYPLLLRLAEKSIPFHYIGMCADNSMPLPYPEQWHHNGYPGATIKDLLDNFAGNVPGKGMITPNLGGYWMTGGKPGGKPLNPDIVLLLAGTNNIIHDPGHGGTDLKGMEEQYTAMLHWFAKNQPGANLFLGTLPPITRQPATQNETVLAFNTWLKNEAPKLAKNTRIVDLYPLFLKPDGTINTALLPDGVHPNQAGYDLMGKAWAEAIMSAPMIANGTNRLLKNDLITSATLPAENKFALPKDKQSGIPAFAAVSATPAKAAPGATIIVSGSFIAGNNAMTAPSVSLKLSLGGHDLPGFTAPAPATLPNLAPHTGEKFQFTFTLPAAMQSGTCDAALSAKAPEGEALMRYGARIIVAP